MSKFEKQGIRAGFTLTEVLITIAIIGIVAMLTVPSLVQKYKKKQTITAVKKFYVMMSNVIRLSEIENGAVDTWDKKYLVFDKNGGYDYEKNGVLNEAYFNKYFAPYLVYHDFCPDYVEKDEDGNVVAQNYSSFYLADGTSVLMKNGACLDFTIDVNADKGPNKGGIDMFTFCLCKKAYRRFLIGEAQWGTYTSERNSREELRMACAKKHSYYCTALLELDGWEFRDDYPLKF